MFPATSDELKDRILKDLVDPKFAHGAQSETEFADLVSRSFQSLWHFYAGKRKTRVDFRKGLARLVAKWTPLLNDNPPALYEATKGLLEDAGFIPSRTNPPQRAQFEAIISSKSADKLALIQELDDFFRGRWP